MATVVCVRFQNTGKVYYFSPANVWPQPGDMVVVETVRGLEMGEAVTGAREISDESVVGELKPIIRKATKADVELSNANRKKEKDAFPVCAQKIKEHGLDMKLVNVECTFDGSKMVFYFTSEGRVDFRELVKELAGIFHTRIELRQIGVRDEARFLGGLGVCGRKICCGAFLSDFTPVSIKMAKEQNLSLNPTKISGQCGRLMCCLKYEQDFYEETLKKLPRIGKDVMTPDGIGSVTEISVIKEKVKVRVKNGDDFEIREYAISDVRRLQPGERNVRPAEEEQKPDDADVREAIGVLEDEVTVFSSNESETEAAPESEKARDGKDRSSRNRYPRPKKRKTMNTDEYMAKNGGKQE